LASWRLIIIDNTTLISTHDRTEIANKTHVEHVVRQAIGLYLSTSLWVNCYKNLGLATRQFKIELRGARNYTTNYAEILNVISGVYYNW